jgi:hypothetical protein
MKKIDISTKKYPNAYTLVDDEDYEYLNQWKWHKGNHGYVSNCKWTNGKTVHELIHRVITKAPKDMYVDHINHNKIDNRRCNLRICTQSQNVSNQRPKKQKYKGVVFIKFGKRNKRWKFEICCNKEKFTSKSYLTEKEAAIAYNEKALELFGEFACLNVIE